MKIGDKVLCIKNRFSVVYNKNIFEKNNYYTITKIYSYSVDIDEYTFSTTETNGSKFWIYSEYFITDKERRKQKLKKLNETRR